MSVMSVAVSLTARVVPDACDVQIMAPKSAKDKRKAKEKAASGTSADDNSLKAQGNKVCSASFDSAVLLDRVL